MAFDRLGIEAVGRRHCADSAPVEPGTLLGEVPLEERSATAQDPRYVRGRANVYLTHRQVRLGRSARAGYRQTKLFYGEGFP